MRIVKITKHNKPGPLQGTTTKKDITEQVSALREANEILTEAMKKEGVE